MSHSTVAHRWFRQTGNLRTNENEFSSGNMFYNQKIIYSYGHHFAIAIRFDDFVLFNEKGYSSSTSKHIGHTRGAIDRYTHKTIYAPFKEARYFEYDVDQKEVYKYIDFGWYVSEFESQLKKLGNARKPELYLSEIDRLQNKLQIIFSKFRGSKTYALKQGKGLRKLLNFEFTDETQQKLKDARLKELEKQRKRKEAKKKEAFQNLLKYEAGENLRWGTTDILDLDTVIRVKGDVIETSKGMRIDLDEGLRVFNLWKQGKAIGVEIKTKTEGTFSCTKANGVIKFGCHIVDFNQANRVLTNHRHETENG